MIKIKYVQKDCYYRNSISTIYKHILKNVLIGLSDPTYIVAIKMCRSQMNDTECMTRITDKMSCWFHF